MYSLASYTLHGGVRVNLDMHCYDAPHVHLNHLSIVYTVSSKMNTCITLVYSTSYIPVAAQPAKHCTCTTIASKAKEIEASARLVYPCSNREAKTKRAKTHTNSLVLLHLCGSSRYQVPHSLVASSQHHPSYVRQVDREEVECSRGSIVWRPGYLLYSECGRWSKLV